MATVGAAAQAGKSTERAVAPGWNESFKAGATDSNGHYMGGGTIMHLVGHQGRLFAADATGVIRETSGMADAIPI